jgi:hypothetical protein
MIMRLEYLLERSLSSVLVVITALLDRKNTLSSLSFSMRWQWMGQRQRQRQSGKLDSSKKEVE